MADEKKHHSLQLTPHFPINTTLPMRGVFGVLLKMREQFMRYVDAMCKAMNSIHE